MLVHNLNNNNYLIRDQGTKKQCRNKRIISLGATIMVGPLTKPLTNELDTAATISSSRASYLNLGVSLVGTTPRSQSHTLYLVDRTRRLKPPILVFHASIAEPCLDAVLQAGPLAQGIQHQNWWFQAPYVLLAECTVCLHVRSVAPTNFAAKSLKARNIEALKIAAFGVVRLE